MTLIELDITKSVDENAGIYFDRAKKAKKKIKGVEDTIARTYDKLNKIEAKLEQQKADIEERESQSKAEVRKKKWYEKFRWFYSSTGFLCIGGRDATTNEIIIKKHADKGDLVFHTDMAGSPFFVIKAEGRDIDEATIQQVADATCTFSRAWGAGISTTSVFYVNPEQVTKEARAGEYLGKGAFMIMGKTNYVRNRMNLAIGIYDSAIMAGPIDAISVHCKDFVLVEPGREKTSAVAKGIRAYLGQGDLDEIIRALPAGGCRIESKKNKETRTKSIASVSYIEKGG